MAQAAGEPLWYLEILVDDCKLYDEALTYLGSLPRRQAAQAVHTFGQVRSFRWQAGYCKWGTVMPGTCALNILLARHRGSSAGFDDALEHFIWNNSACIRPLAAVATGAADERDEVIDHQLAQASV